MPKFLKYLLTVLLLTGAVTASGQFIDTVCVGTIGRGYHVFGLPGSTYSWNIPGGTPAPDTNNDTIFVNWGLVPGVYTISVIETTTEGCVAPQVVGAVNVTSGAVANAGPDVEACSGIPVIIAGSSASNYSSIKWIYNGPGILTGSNTLHPEYTPDAGFTGEETLIMKAYSVLPCTDSITDTLKINVYPTPTGLITLAGTDVLCEGDSTFLRIDLTGSPPWSVSISDGIDTVTYSNITTSPYIITVKPVIPVVYTITALSDIHCPALPSGLNGVVPIFVNPAPGAEFSWNLGTQNNEIVFHLDTTVVNTPAVGNMVLWYFGDGTYGYGYNPVHVFPAPDTYNVTLVVTDTNGCQSRISHPVIIPVTPIAFFSSNAPVCDGTAVCFTDLSTVSLSSGEFITRWTWDFGDGSPLMIIDFPESPDTCHTYPSIGTYDARLTIVTNLGYTSHYTRSQIIIPGPVAGFTTSGGCQSQPVFFTNTSDPGNGGTISSWNWNFGDPLSGTSNFSTLYDAVHVFSTGNTTYHVTLIVSNVNQCSDTIMHPVYIFPLPPVAFTNSVGCNGEAVQFSVDTAIINPDSIVQWTWDFGDGSPAVNTSYSVSHLYASTGNYITTLTVKDKRGCENSISHQVIVNPLPVAQFSWSSVICSNSPVLFNNASVMPPGAGGYIARWQWDFGDGTPAVTISLPSSPDVYHTFPAGNFSYNVKLKVWSNDSCSQETIKVVTPALAPVADFQASSTNCVSQAVQFTNATSAGGINILSYQWNFNDPQSGTNNVSSLENPSHIFSSPGNYNVILIVINVNGCSDTVIKTVFINPSPVAEFSADTACLNSPTNFSNTSLPGSSEIISCYWDFGDGSYSSLTNSQHIYQNSGTYSVTLTITNNNGCSDSYTGQIIVNPLPVASFTFSQSGCQGDPVTFTNTSVGMANNSWVVRWIWDFGDGTTAVINYPGNPVISHIFAGTASFYVVRLTVITNDSCSNFTEHTIQQNPSPVASFSSSHECQNQQVMFNDLSSENGGGPIVSWNWIFGDPLSGTNNTSALQNPVHVFGSPGNYPVTLVISNAGGCSDTISRNILILSQPLADFIVDSTCLGSPSVFTDNSVSGGTIVQWLWDFGDGGTSSLANPVHTYPASGTYHVTLTVTTSQGCSGSVTKDIYIIPKPISAFTFSSPSCAGDSVSFTNFSTSAGGTIISWLWDFGDGNTQLISVPQSPDVKHKYQTGNNYTVNLTVTASVGCTDLMTHTVPVLTSPVANFTFPYGHCENIPVQFTDLTQTAGGSAIVQWEWDFNDPLSGASNTSALQNPVHSFSSGGSYNVLLRSVNLDGCSDTIIRTVVVSDAPSAMFTATNACEGTSTHFTDASTTTSGSVSVWLWNFGDPGSGLQNASNLQNPDHVFSSPGNYLVTLTVVNTQNCTADTVITVSVKPKPTAMFTYVASCVNSGTPFTDLSVAPGSQIIAWNWDFGDGKGTSTNQNPVYTYSEAGTYNVKLRIVSLNNCEDSITLVVVSYPLPVADFSYTSFYCPPGKVIFQDQSIPSSGNITERLWTFEPGYTSTLPDPEFVFSTTGTVFPVSLYVTNSNGCRDTVIYPVEVKPGFSFGFTNDTVCFSSPTHFIAQNFAAGDTLFNLLWNFGDPESGAANISHEYQPVHTYSHPGLFTVSLQAVNSDGCESVVYKDIVVRSLPESSYTTTLNADGRTVLFDETSVPGNGYITTWEWNFGDNSPNIIIPAPGPGTVSHTYSSSGTYITSLKVTNIYGCSIITEKPVIIISTAIAGFNASDTLVCAGNPVILCDSSKGVIQQWSWFFGDNSDTTCITSNNCITHRYMAPGTYTVKLVIQATFGGEPVKDSVMKKITVKPSALAAFDNNVACADENVQFTTAPASNEPGMIYQWTFDDPVSGQANFSAMKNPAHKFIRTGMYNVKLFVSNSSGCTDSLVRAIRVHDLPVAGFLNDLVCTEKPAFFTDKTEPGDTSLMKWEWDFGDASTIHFSALQNPQHIFRNEGKYNIRLVVKDFNGCADTAYSLVNVFSSPLSAFSISEKMQGMPGKISLINHSSGADHYLWDFGNGTSSTEENPVVTYEESQLYLIQLVAYTNHECTDTTYMKYENLIKGLYIPNAFAPGSGTGTDAEIFKPVGINLTTYNIEIFDNWGHRIWTSDKIDAEGRPSESWDGRDTNGRLMPQGTYVWIVRAQFSDGTVWEGSDIGKGDYKTMGTVTLIR